MTETNFIEVDYNPFEEGKEIEKVITLNESQKEIWLSCIIGGDTASLAYNESVSLKLTGRFNFSAFQDAVKMVTSRHEALRATVSKDGENLIVYNKVDVEVVFSNLSHVGSQLLDQELKTFVQKEISIPFNLYEGPLLKLFVHKLDDDTHYFTIIIHHIIGDGWSLGIFLEDLSNCYNACLSGIKLPLQPPDQISKYALEQVAFIRSEEYKQTQQFWLDQYKDDVPVLDMPLDFSRPVNRTYQGKRNDYIVDPELYESVKRLSVKSKSSVVSTLIAAFEVFLYNQTGQEDIVLGLPAAGQLASENLNLIGHCVNLLPLRSRIDPNASFINYLLNRKNEILDAYDHQRLTFSELLKKLNVKRNKANIPLVPVVFNVDRGMDDAVSFSGLSHQIISNPRVSQTFEISLNVNGSKDSMIFEWAYNTQLFTSETINRMMDDFVSLLMVVSENPETLIADTTANINPFPDITPATLSFPQNLTILDLFEHVVATRANDVAVVCEGKSLTYKDLDTRANQLANYFANKGLENNALVPICIHPSLETVIGIIAILKAGGTYVPIDPEYPICRIKIIIDEIKSNHIICDKVIAKKLNELVGQEIIQIDDEKTPVWQENTSKPLLVSNPDALAYIIYTSGSTGNPKGVMIPHVALADYLFGLRSKISGLKDCKSFALGSSVSTDLGNTTLFSALTLGAQLHIFAKDRFNNTDYIHRYFTDNQIDFLKIVPSQWKFLMTQQRLLLPKKILMFGGEALPAEYIKLINASDASCQIVNHYGPTETTIGKLIHLVDKDFNYPVIIPIGKPFSNTTIYVLNKNLKNCPVGVPGELYIGGLGLAKGYLNNSKLTDSVFVKNPNSDVEERIYKTGDLVKWLAGGDIEYLGRIDDQIKIRGNRIELGEIQNTLQKHPNIKQSAVFAVEVEQNEKELVAYLVLNGSFDRDNVVQFLRKQLPEYMVPKIYMELDNLPLTSNGKVDRKALPEFNTGNQSDVNDIIEPQNDMQALVADIWSKNLNLEKISIKDDFFELGGHSMIAIKVMVEIEKQTNLRLPLSILFDNSTVEKFALQLNKSKQDINWDSLIPIKLSGSKAPLYIVHGQGMNIIVFKPLAKEIDAERPIYGLQPKGLNPEIEPLETIEEIAADYIKEIIANNPSGPYLIMGYSSGGTIALEMSNQMAKMGKKVSFLGLLDTYFDGESYLQLASKNNHKEIINWTFKFVGFGFVYLFRHPKEFLRHKVSFTFGTMYNLYKKIKPIEKDLSNPKYVLSKIQSVHAKAFHKYKIKKYDADVHLFKSNDILLSYIPHAKTNGWAPYINGKLTLIDIPLEHLQFFKPEYVKILSDKLNAVLRSIES
ncbi:non-ribosomal peptide synthetase [Pedobacter sp. Leaf194]|uniref:non-ribosomal peptide synthetase n=1 Tax=Pedobacter sp. Leaf194 TaxID=1736297 RepID=UPI0007030710|nr:non-ribosomal peptide synthetase [Pedobacter sp. Leaf194]KQS32325.1 hypothetical protein ASG14_17450 [Pedobacter sp. Leaf194]